MDWFAQERPVQPGWRCLFYTMLLCANDSPMLKAAIASHQTAPHWQSWLCAQLISMVGVRGVALASNLSWVVLMLLIVFSLLQVKLERKRWLRIEHALLWAMALLYSLLHAVKYELTDYQHQFYMVLYSLWILAICGPSSPRVSRVVLMCLVHTYASASLAKLLNNGREWINGEFICRLLSRRNDTGFMLNIPCIPLSLGAIMTEAGSLLALWQADSAVVRWTFIMVAICFHTFNSIYIGATFNAQMICLLLVLPKRRTARNKAGTSRTAFPRLLMGVLIFNVCAAY